MLHNYTWKEVYWTRPYSLFFKSNTILCIFLLSRFIAVVSFLKFPFSAFFFSFFILHLFKSDTVFVKIKNGWNNYYYWGIFQLSFVLFSFSVSNGGFSILYSNCVQFLFLYIHRYFVLYKYIYFHLVQNLDEGNVVENSYKSITFRFFRINFLFYDLYKIRCLKHSHVHERTILFSSCKYVM